MARLLVGTRAQLKAPRLRPVISGNTIKSDTGQILRGAGQMSVRASAPKATDPAMWQRLRDRGMSVGRVDVRTNEVGRTPAQQLPLIDQAVALAKNMFCYVCLVWAVVPYFDSDASNLTAMLDFWKAAAPRYKNDTHVFFEICSEPTDNGFTPYLGHADSWIDPNTDAARNATHWIWSGYNTVRNLAPNTLILIPSTANMVPSANRFRTVMQVFEALGQPIDWTKTAFSYHHYKGTMVCGVNAENSTDWGMDGVAAMRQWYPMFMTETQWWRSDLTSDTRFKTLLRKYERDGVAWVLLDGTTTSPDYLQTAVTDLHNAGYTWPLE